MRRCAGCATTGRSRAGTHLIRRSRRRRRPIAASWCSRRSRTPIRTGPATSRSSGRATRRAWHWTGTVRRRPRPASRTPSASPRRRGSGIIPARGCRAAAARCATTSHAVTWPWSPESAGDRAAAGYARCAGVHRAAPASAAARGLGGDAGRIAMRRCVQRCADAVWPEHLPPLQAPIERAAEATLRACDGLRAAARARWTAAGVSRVAPGRAARMEALYPLAAVLPSVSRFFLAADESACGRRRRARQMCGPA